MQDRTSGPHLRPVLRITGFAAWWWITVVIAGGILVVVLGSGVVDDAFMAGTGFWVLLVFVMLGELRPVVTSGRTDPDGVNLATAFIFAVLVYWGVGLALVGVLVSAGVGEIVRGKRLYALVFNLAQYTVSYAAAWAVLGLAGWEASATMPAQLTPEGLFPLALAAAAYHLTNITVVGTALALADRRSIVSGIFEDFGYYTSTTGAVIALSPLVVVVLDQHWAFLPLLLLPLYLLYRTAEMSLDRERRTLCDELTGLGNRALLHERLEKHVASGRPAAVCLLDLDRFKEVNDTLGHAVGDEVLRLVAERLAAGTRPEDTVARLGGDEFVLLLDVETVADALLIVGRLIEHLHEPYEVADSRLEVDASSGLAFHPDHGTDLDVLLRRADAAMYAAKEASSSTVVFTDDLEQAAPFRLALLADLRRGIGDGELEIHYQPQVRLADGATVGLEALVRWRHPEQGLLLPGDFLSLIERTAVMRMLTTDVLDQVLAQLSRWSTMGLGLPVAVNVSPRDLTDDLFARRVVEGLRRHRIDPARLSLEITEQALVGDPSRIFTTLADLRAGGVELSLDDFGTGHASLTRLRSLPVSEVKIDRSFVESFQERAEDRAIVTAVIELARGLGLRCVAEGVETAPTWHALAELGCDVAQGYHLSPPMPAPEIEAWLRRPNGVTWWPLVGGPPRLVGAVSSRPDGG